MILVDSGAFIALLVPEDDHHQEAVSYHKSSSMARWTLNTIVAETYTHLRYRFGAPTALSFLDGISTLQSGGGLFVAYVDEPLAIVAEGILRQYADMNLSYVDATALAWLRTRPQIRHVFGFDEHWRVEGHILIP